MLILGIDTSSSFLNLSLWDEGIIEESYSLDGGLNHSEKLVPQIINLLNKCGKNVKDLDKVVCTVGPGSFTGIRIGVSTANALSMSLGIPVIGVSTLEVLLFSSQVKNGVVVATMDAQRDSYYTLWGKIENEVIKKITVENVETKTEITNRINDFENIYIIGDGSKLWKDMPEKLINTNIVTLDPLELCKIGSKLNYDGNYIEPVYIRKSQAEVEYELRKTNGR